MEAARVAVRSDPYEETHYQRLAQRMPPNKARVAIARRLLVSVWHILTRREPDRHFDDETIAHRACPEPVEGC